MNRFFVSLLTLSLLAGAGAIIQPSAFSASQGAKKKPAAAAAQKKPAPPAKKPGGPVVLGTTQLPGDFGQFGQTYTIGTNRPLNFTLKSAEYTVMPVVIGGSIYLPKEGEKLLVLHYTVHNPNPRDTRYYWGEIIMTAVDARDVNRKFISAAAREGDTDPLNIQLKPAQKIEAWSAIIVPAEGVVPKLIVQREPNAPVVRYDLRGKVTPLPAAFADPSDATGATVLKQWAGKPGEWYPMGRFDMRLESLAYTTEALGGRPPAAGGRYLVGTFTIKSRAPVATRYYWADFEAIARDADGEKTKYTQRLLKANRDEVASGNLEKDEEITVRLFTLLPANVEAKTFEVRQRIPAGGLSRPVIFDVANTMTASAAAAGG